MSKVFKIHLFTWAIFLGLVFAACVPEAPRQNPLDPDLGGGERPALEGWVFSFYEPREALENVLLTLEPSSRVQLTDSEGYYRFANLEPGTYRLIAQKEDYAGDTLTITLSPGEQGINRTIFLNGLPRLLRYHYFSEHIDRIYPGEFSRALLAVVAADPDGVGDIDSVRWDIPNLEIHKPLQRTSRPDSFVAIIEDIELPRNNLFLLTETPGVLTLKDRPGAVVTAASFTLPRIISQQPHPLSPGRFDTTGAFPEFSWQSPGLPFEFFYTLEIYQQFVPVPLASLNPSPDSNRLEFPDSLANGQYYWTLGVRDRLNNFSRSQENYFIVLNPHP